MVKSYVAETVLRPHHMAQLSSRGSSFISADDLRSGGAVSYIHFNKLKDLNAYKRNLASGKKYRLSTEKVKDIVDQEGGSLMKGLKSFGNVMGKAFRNDTIVNGLKQVGNTMGEPFEKTFQVNPFTAGYDLGHDVIAPALMKAGIGPKYKKEGGKLTAKKIGRQFKRAFESKAVKSAGKRVAKSAKEIVRDNKGELSAIGRDLVGTALSVANGEASRADLNSAVADSMKKAVHVGARDQLTRVGVVNEANPYLYGQYKPPPVVVAPEPVYQEEVLEGAGFVGSFAKSLAKHASKPLAEAVVRQAVGGAIGSYGLGGARITHSFQNAKDRMAYVRAHKKGGSMRPLGGSMVPL